MSDVFITYLGHAAFKITDGEKTLLIDPWVLTNPKCPEDLKKMGRVDLMLITHAHFDHLGDTHEFAKTHEPKIVGMFELCKWLEAKGVRHLMPMNKGGTQKIDGFSVTMVHADHSCGILEGNTIGYAGEAAGYVVTLPSGLKIYHAGDTNIFGDMKLIAELYAPDIACLPIGDHFTMGPREAAHAAKLLNAKTVIPMHYDTFPALTGTPKEFIELLRGEDTTVKKMSPGETWRIENNKL